MPSYEFQCKKCSKVYDDLVPYDETNKYKGVICPHCGSKRKTRMISACNFMFAQPEGTDRWNSESGGHGYRFEHNKPKVRAERAAAQAAGDSNTPYNPINDIDTDANWGEVK